MPEGLRECFGFDGWSFTEQFLETGRHAESRRVPERVRPGAARHEQARDVPAAVANGVAERRAIPFFASESRRR